MPSSNLASAILAAAILSAVLHLRAEYLGKRWQVYVFKPLTTSLLLGLAVVPPSLQGARYQAAVGAGLACSLLGDVFLMLPQDRFLAGLASFLLAHLAYLVAFTTGVSFGTSPLLLIPFLFVAIVLLRVLWTHLGALRLPVLGYTTTILLMVWQAWARQGIFSHAGSTTAALGATLFLASDSLLALNRFWRPLPHGHTWVMITYVAAQALIALSVGLA